VEEVLEAIGGFGLREPPSVDDMEASRVLLEGVAVVLQGEPRGKPNVDDVVTSLVVVVVEVVVVEVEVVHSTREDRLVHSLLVDTSYHTSFLLSDSWPPCTRQRPPLEV